MRKLASGNRLFTMSPRYTSLGRTSRIPLFLWSTSDAIVPSKAAFLGAATTELKTQKQQQTLNLLTESNPFPTATDTRILEATPMSPVQSYSRPIPILATVFVALAVPP